MKRMIVRSLADLIEKIKYIVYVSEKSDLIYASEQELEEDMEFYSTIPDHLFADLDRETVQKFKELRLIDRAVKLCKDKLSAEQVKLIQQEYKKKYRVSEADVRSIVEMLQKCSKLYAGSSPYRKLTDFKDKYNLDDSDLLKIVHSLDVNDYQKSTKNVVYPYLGNLLMIFKKYNYRLPDSLVVNLTLYIKLDIDETTDDTIAVLSIHEDE